MSKTPSQPASPDYVGAANATAAGNLEAVKYQTEANRVNQTTPFGNLTWSKDANGNWTQATTLSPELQQAYDAQGAVTLGKSQQAASMLQSVKDSYATPMDAPTRTDYTSGVGAVNQSNLGTAGTFSSNANQDTTFNSTAPGINANYAGFTTSNPALNTTAKTFDGAGSGQDTTNLASSGYTKGAQALSQDASTYLNGVNPVNQAAPQYNQDNAALYAQKAYEAQMALLQPGMDDQQQKLQNSLALQGLNPGTEANNNAQSSYSMALAAQKNALAASSYASGAQTAQGNYASQLAGFNASNAAQNQAYGQGLSTMAADNTAKNTVYQQGLASQAADISATTASNAAKNTAYNQNANTFNVNQAATQQSNAALTQQLNNELSQYGANQSAQTASNAASATMTAQQFAAYQAQNAASAQQYGQDLSGYNANLSGLQTNAGLQAASNAAQGQAYSQALNNYSTDYSAAETARNQPLNELNSLLTGTQVTNPTFNSYALQGNAGGADILGATTAQGQYDQSAYNAQAASAAGTNSSIAGLAGTAAMAFAMY